MVARNYYMYITRAHTHIYIYIYIYIQLPAANPPPCPGSIDRRAVKTHRKLVQKNRGRGAPESIKSCPKPPKIGSRPSPGWPEENGRKFVETLLKKWSQTIKNRVPGPPGVALGKWSKNRRKTVEKVPSPPPPLDTHLPRTRKKKT